MIDALMEDPVARVLMMRYEFWASLLLFPLLVDAFIGKRKSVLLWLRGVMGALVFLWGVYIAGATVWTTLPLAPKIAGVAGPFLVFWIMLSLSTAAWFIYLGWPHVVPVLGGDESRLSAREQKVAANRALFIRISLALFFGWLFYPFLIAGNHVFIMFWSNYGLVAIGAYALLRGIVEIIFRGLKTRRIPALLSSAAGAMALFTGLFGVVYFIYKLVGGPGWVLRPFDPFVWPTLLGLGLLLYRYVGAPRPGKPLRFNAAQLALGVIAIGLLVWIRADCRARVDELKDWLSNLVADAKRAGSAKVDPTYVENLVKLPAGKPGEVSMPGYHETYIGVSADSFYLFDSSDKMMTEEHFSELEGVGQELDNLYKREPDLKPRSDFALCVYRDTPWRFLVRVISAVTHDKARGIAFVFLSPKPRALPSPPASELTSVFEEIDRILGPRKWKIFDYYPPFGEYITRPCYKLLLIFSASVYADRIERLELDASAYPGAITQCCCDIDMESFKTFIWHYGDFGEPIDLVRLEFAAPGDDKAKTIALPGDLPWSKAYEHVLAAASEKLPLRFAVAGD